MRRSLTQLEELSKQRQAELREAPAPRLRYLNDGGSVIVAHVEQAQRGLVPLRGKLPRWTR